MPKFRYEAMGSTGEAASNLIQAATADEAMHMLRTKGLFVVALKEVTDGSADAGSSEASATAADSVPSSHSNAEKIGPPGRWVGAIVTAVGLVCAAVGLYGVFDSLWFGMGAKRAEAVVVEVRRGNNSAGWDYDVLEFTVAGHTYRVEGRGCFGVLSVPSQGLRVSVDVLYPPDRPESARLAAFQRNYGGPLILLVLGLMFTPCGVLVFRRGIRLKSSRVPEF